MLRTIYWFTYFWTYLLFTIPSLCKVMLLEKKNAIQERDEIVNKMAKNWARSLVKVSGSKVSVTGEKNIPEMGPVLFVSNHQSAFDIPILIGYIDKPKAFVAKKEIKRLPIVGSWMSYMQCVFMDRKDVRQSLQAINKGAENLKNGYSLVIFPEGTRSTDGRMLEFKPGSLKLAIKAGVQIVPITIKGSYKIMEKNSLIIKPADVEVIISPPVQIEPFKNEAKGLSAHIYECIEKKL